MHRENTTLFICAFLNFLKAYAFSHLPLFLHRSLTTISLRIRGESPFSFELTRLENALDPLIDSSFELLVSPLIPCLQPLIIDAL